MPVELCGAGQRAQGPLEDDRTSHHPNEVCFSDCLARDIDTSGLLEVILHRSGNQCSSCSSLRRGAHTGPADGSYPALPESLPLHAPETVLRDIAMQWHKLCRVPVLLHRPSGSDTDPS